MLSNELKVGKNIVKRIKLRNAYCAVLIVLGIASIYVSTSVPLATGNVEYSKGYYLGLGISLIVASIITIIKNIRLLRNEKALQEREIYESDERNQMIGLKTWSYAGYAMFVILYIAILITGAINVTVMNTILAVLAAFALCIFIVRTILSKVM